MDFGEVKVGIIMYPEDIYDPPSHSAHAGMNPRRRRPPSLCSGEAA
jgi:hypothetical protein